jgi:hypothetical protein
VSVLSRHPAVSSIGAAPSHGSMLTDSTDSTGVFDSTIAEPWESNSSTTVAARAR